MPKNAPALNEQLKGLLSTWVNAGAPNGSAVSTPVDNELKANWESLSRKVFFPKCVQCHNPEGQAKFLDLSTRQRFFEARDDLLNNFENPETSYLVEVITDPAEPMPPAFSGLNPLSKNEVNIIIKWIELGLP